MVTITEADYQAMKASALAEIHEREETLDKLQKRHDAVMVKIMNLMPECWDGDNEETVIDFVESLLGASGVPGHTDDCTCFYG